MNPSLTTRGGSGFQKAGFANDGSGFRNLEKMTPEQRSAWDAAYRAENAAFHAADLSGEEFDEIEIDMYRLVAEALDEEGEGLETLDIELPGDALCMSLPEEFVALTPTGLIKYEVLATEDSGNQTIFEGEFALDDTDECEDDDEDEDEDDD